MAAIFRTKCLNCEEVFGLPSVGDFSYGDTYFGCECGKAFAYHSCLSHPVSLIFELLCEIYGVESEGIFDFSAFFADKITGHRLKYKHICPKCKSEKLSFSGKRIETAIWDIPIATYNRLYGLNKDVLLREFEQYLKLKEINRKKQ